MGDAIIQAYNTLNDLPITEGMQALTCLIGAIVVLAKIAKTIQENMSDNQVDIKSIFKLIWVYILIITLISVSPVIFTGIENLLASISDELTAQYQRDINMDIDAMLKNFIDEKTREVEDAGFFEEALVLWFMSVEIFFYTVILYIIKFVYLVFMSARYLWLILLKISAPIAIVCFMDESLRDISKTYLKNLFNCYLMLPCFLITNNFAEEIVRNVARGVYGVSETSVLLQLLGLCLKLFLFGKAFQYAKQLI